MARKQKLYTCKITDISPEGMGISTHNGKQLFVIGGVPGEELTVLQTKKRKTYIQAVVQEVHSPSPYRTQAHEDHYLSCSPLQPFSYDFQLSLKKEMLSKAYKEYAGTSLPITEFFGATETREYRNKMEFSFWNEEGSMYLAFHKRGSPFLKVALPGGCLLGGKTINDLAYSINLALNTAGISKQDLKVLMVRESKSTGKGVALLLVTNKEREYPLKKEQFPAALDGFCIAYSSPRSPAGNIEEVLYSEGNLFLDEEVCGMTIRYPLDGFFQNNIPLFETAIQQMKQHISPAKKMVELYSGVGTIGLLLHDLAEEVIGVELVPSAVEMAAHNAKVNGIANYTAIHSASEHIDGSLLDATDILVLDPPRAGLHPDVIKMVIERKPKQIIYLSCNPSTQARDYALLREHYSPTHLSGYDFYPNALHLESLLVLEHI